MLRINPADGEKASTTQVVASGYPAMTDLSLGTLVGGRFYFVADSGWALFDPPPALQPPARELTIYSFAVK